MQLCKSFEKPALNIQLSTTRHAPWPAPALDWPNGLQGSPQEPWRGRAGCRMAMGN